MILGSGIALGVFVPALSLKLQLENEGHRADLLCVEELYSGKDDVMEETRKSFHKDFRLAQLSYRLPTRNKAAVDPQVAEEFLKRMSDELYDAAITFSGFWADLLNGLIGSCAHYNGKVFAIHMDASRSLSWKGVDTSKIKEIWLYRLDNKNISYTLEKAITDKTQPDRILVHGGGWGLGEYREKIKILNELGYLLDIVIYQDDELDEADEINSYYLLDPKWKPYHGENEFPRLLKYQNDEWIDFVEDRKKINPLRELIKRNIAILSKPGGGTIYDSLVTGTPLIFSDELATYEADNRKLWEEKGFGIGFEDFILKSERDLLLKEMRDSLRDCASALPIVAEIL
ncbi:MAG: hypothetical protein IJI66_05860 [Erysipelotrichaceae bacterium]|nr:hypothetical protein [Erysipelotrichaceae bacterium]